MSHPQHDKDINEVKYFPTIYYFCIKKVKREAGVKKGGRTEKVSKCKQKHLGNCKTPPKIQEHPVVHCFLKV